jgi:FG-GAP-like repeat
LKTESAWQNYTHLHKISDTLGDLNNDGFPDLIVGGDPLSTSIFDGKLFVMLGKGNGNFQPKQTYLVGYSSFDSSAPYIDQIEVTDVNNDGNLDVIVSHNGERSTQNRSSTFITVLIGNGNGTLIEAEGYTLFSNFGGSVMSDFNLADVNGDNLLDIVVAINIRSDLSRLHVLKNIGGGNFQDLGGKVIGTNISSLVAANINGDRFIDFVVTTPIGVFILFGTEQIFPNISFEQRDPNIFETTLIVRDFNGDGRLDLVVLPFQGQEFRVFLNSQFGFPQNPVIYPVNSVIDAIGINDFDKDGKPDLLCYTNNNLKIYRGDGTGSFIFYELIPNIGIFYGTTDDFDKNGKLDIATPTNNVGVHLNAPNSERYYSDFDGDLKSDLTVFRPTTGTWWTFLSSTGNYRSTKFGISTDKPVAGNYDGDNKADIAVYRNGVWYVLQSSDNSIKIENWGSSGDIPIPADYDNDGKMNLAVYRPTEGIWYIKKDVGFEAVKFGISSDKPVPADYDGDGKTDIAVWRGSNGFWYIRKSKDNQITYQKFGITGDKPVQADYDGDGKSDVAVFRPSDSFRYILQSNSGTISYNKFGLADDIPLVNDFDGDGKSDISVFRANTGFWYFLKSTDNSFNFAKWGTAGDLPVAP